MFSINSFFVRGYVSPRSTAFCHFWQSIDYVFTAWIIWCTAIFTLQRHIFVFYPNYLRTQRQRLIFHYIPFVLINLYLFLFYILTTFIGICTEDIDFNRFLCGDQCLDRASRLSVFNWVFNILFPVFIVIFGSLILLIRVLWVRRDMQRNLRNWSKNWKMTVQLLGIAIIYIVVWIPLAIISIILIFDNNRPSVDNVEDYWYFATYLCELSVPCAALFLSTELMQHLCRRLRPSLINIPSVSVRQYSTN